MITLLMVVHERKGPRVGYAYLYDVVVVMKMRSHSCSVILEHFGQLTWMKSIPNQGVNTHGHQKESECPSKTETKGEEYWYSCW